MNIIILFICLLFLSTAVESSTAFNTEIQQLINSKSFSAAESKLRAHLKSYPNDSKTKFLLSRVLAWQQKYDQAISVLDRLISTSPLNSDYLLVKAQVLHWSDNNQQALKIIQKAKTISPEYADIWKLELRITQRYDKEQFDKLYALALKKFENASWLEPFGYEAVRVSSVPKLNSEIEAGVSYEDLTSPYDPWSSMYLAGSHAYSNTLKLFANYERFSRFDLTDREVVAGIVYEFPPNWSLNLQVGNSDTHLFRPRSMLDAEIFHSFEYKINTSIGIRRSEYDTTTTELLRFVVDKYWRKYRLSFNLNHTSVDADFISNESNQTYVFAVDYYYDASTIGVALVSGKELEYDGSAAPPISDIEALLLKGAHWYKPHWAVTYLISYHKQGDIYSRNGVRVGIRHSF